MLEVDRTHFSESTDCRMRSNRMPGVMLRSPQVNLFSAKTEA